jgi:hypothetical protein
MKISKEARAATREFPGDFEARLRALVPHLPDAQSPLIVSPETDSKRFVLTFADEKRDESWSVVGRVRPSKGELVVQYAYRNLEPTTMSRDEAVASVTAEIGQDPWPLSGAEYAKQAKREWSGLLPRE